MEQVNVTFVTVRSGVEKCQQLGRIVEEEFSKGENISVFVDNEGVAKFVDNLLWTYKEESFLPHSYIKEKSESAVVITECSENLNRSNVLINLTSCVPSHYKEFSHIFELKDESSKEKFALAKGRFNQYQKENCDVKVV